MRQALKLSALALIATVGAQCASAQTLRIDQVTTALSSVQNQAAVTINPSNGEVVVLSTQNYSSCASTQSAVVFTSAPASGTVNSTIQLSWATTNPSGTNPCTPTQGGSTNWVGQGAAPANGTRSVTLPSTPGSVTFGMQCNTVSGPITATATVNVTQQQTGNCSGTSPSVITPTSFPSNWTDVFGSQNTFPNPIGTARRVVVPVNGAVALRFIAQTGGLSVGRMESAESPGEPGGPLRVSISECAGDFRDELNTGKLCLYRGLTNQGQVLFAINQFSSGVCGLTVGSTYYANVTHLVPAYPPEGIVDSTCPAGSCMTLMTTRDLNQAEVEALGLRWIPPGDGAVFDGD